MKKYVWQIIFLLIFFSCTPVEEASETAEILNKGINGVVDFEVIGNLDRGEFLLGGQGDDITIRVKNNTAYNLSDAKIDIALSSAGVKFSPNESGDSESPGFGGSCQSIIAPGESCTYKLRYEARSSGEHTQDVSFSYKSLIDDFSKTVQLKFLTGTPASLIFESDEINYSFGVVERTEPKVFSERLVVVNTGELTARGIKFTKLDNTTSNAISVISNTCGTELVQNETCEILIEFEAKNYGVGAPDGNLDFDYTTNIRFDYDRDPEGGQSALNAYFDARSIRIQGDIQIGGLPNLSFDDLIVGNIETQTLKLTNKGYKEGILLSVDIRDPANNLIARCVRDGSDNLACRDSASDITSSASNLPLTTIPFKFEDASACFIDVDDFNYTRGEDGNLVNSSIKEMKGRTIEDPGGSCFFTVTFHPSVTFMSDGNFNNYRFNIRFDSTWKDTVDIRNDLDTDENSYIIDDANYLAAAKLSFDIIEYKNDTYLNSDLADNDFFDYDLGRISLIASSNYKDRVRIRIVNTGSSFGEVLSITDGASPTPNNITETSYNINTYYQNIKHSGCDVVNPYSGQCDILFDLNPLVSSNPDSAQAEAEENGAMYDVLGAYPNRYKIFQLKYKDGTTYNDDMSPRVDREITMNMRGLLVRKGLLAFSDYSMTEGLTYPAFSGANTQYFHLKLENVGTGGITYINMDNPVMYPGSSNWTTDSSTALYGSRIVDNPTSALISGVDKDCYEFMDFGGTAGPAAAAPNTNAPSLLGPGEICTLTFEMSKMSNDRVDDAYYNSADRQWLRWFSAPLNGSHALREYSSDQFLQSSFSFEYYDGDGIPDAGTGYSPQLDGHGSSYVTVNYPVNIASRQPAVLVPDAPQPMISSVLWRQAINIPSHAPLAGEWGKSFAAYSLSEMWRDLTKGSGNPPITYSRANSQNRLSGFLDTSYDYVFYGGTYFSGENTELSFRLTNNGNMQAGSLVPTLNGDAEFALSSIPTNVGSGGSGNVIINFTPSAQGTFTTELEITYLDGSKDLTDRDNYSYTDKTKTLRILIVAEAVASNTGRISMTSQRYGVEYNEQTENFTENLDSTLVNHNLVMNGYDPNTAMTIEAVRGSSVYAKARLNFTNYGSTTVNNISFNLKGAVSSSTASNSGAGVGYQIVFNNCTGSLAPGDSCYSEVIHQASPGEPGVTTRYGAISYEIGPDQYYAEYFRVNFTAVDPAKVKVGNLSTNVINDGNGGTIQDAYPINLGAYSNLSHPIHSTYPTGQVVKTIAMTNPSNEKASFLKQYRNYVGDQNATIPGTEYVTIYSQGALAFAVNRPCFYGDDEGSGLPEEEWGFNINTISSCTLKVTFTFDDNYLGEDIVESENYGILSYYDSKRASVSTIPIYIKGFVEPNRSNAQTNKLYNVVTDDTGYAYLEWDPFTPGNPDWGPIVRYRVFYSEFSINLNNVFSSDDLTYVDTIGTETNAEITGLLLNRFYYLRVVAVRETPSGKEFLSVPNNFSVKPVIVPDETAIYDYDRKLLIDKFTLPKGSSSPDFITKSEAVTSCQTSTRTIRKEGSNRTRSQQLIDIEDYELINSDPNNSNYPFYAFPHWLADAPEDVAPLFPGFSCDITNMHNEDDSIMYIKDCDNCTCNTLSKIVGGEDFPLDTIIFAYDDFNGAARCRVSQDIY